jgi:hypothetical protein
MGRGLARRRGAPAVPPALPPATTQLRGCAEILDWTDPAGTAVFRSFWMGRRILEACDGSRRRGETRVCFLRITPDGGERSSVARYHRDEAAIRAKPRVAQSRREIGEFARREWY